MAERRKKIVEQLEKGRPVKTPQYITTGNTLRDLIIGGNKGIMGYEVGNIYNIVGDSSSGKTGIIVHSIVANYFKLGKKLKFCYDDAELGNTFNVKEIYDMDIPLINEDTPRSSTVEDLYINVRKFCETVKSDQIGVYVLDSLDALTSKATVDRGNKRMVKAEKGKELEEGTYAMDKQKFLSQEFFPDISARIKDSNIILIIVSQVRDKINAGLFEKKQTRSGGRALQFYCHTVEWLAQIEKKEMEDESGLRSGIPILLQTDKSKTPRPYRKGIIILDYSIGLDNIASNIDYLYDLRTKNSDGKLSKSYALRPTIKNRIDWDAIMYTRNELCDFIYDNELEAELEKRVIAKWEEAESRLKNRRKPRF